MNPTKYQQRHIVYKSTNPIIQFIAKQFGNRIEGLLRSINANKKFGFDLGCGECHLLYRLITRGCLQAVIACDLSKSNLYHAHQAYPNLIYLQANGKQLPVKDACLDFVMATEILEHVNQPDTILEEIVRITKPNAYFIISVPNEPFFHLCALFSGRNIMRLGKTPRHLSFWSRRSFKKLLSKYMVIEQCYTISTFPWQLYLCKKKSS